MKQSSKPNDLTRVSPIGWYSQGSRPWKNPQILKQFTPGCSPRPRHLGGGACWVGEFESKRSYNCYRYSNPTGSQRRWLSHRCISAPTNTVSARLRGNKIWTIVQNLTRDIINCKCSVTHPSKNWIGIKCKYTRLTATGFIVSPRLSWLLEITK